MGTNALHKLIRWLPTATALLLLATTVVVAAPGKQDNGAGALLLAVLMMALGLVCMVALIVALRPSFAERAAAAASQRRGRSALWGLALLALVLLLVAMIGGATANAGGRAEGLGGLLAVLILAATAVCTLLGLAGLSHTVGQTFLSEPTPPAPKSAALGAAVLVGASLVPILGQIVAVVVLVLSLGVFAQASVARRAPQPPAEPEGPQEQAEKGPAE